MMWPRDPPADLGTRSRRLQLQSAALRNASRDLRRESAMLSTSSIAVAVGAALLAAVVWRFFRYTEYSLYLTTAGGEKQAITSRDHASMLELRNSLNDALATGAHP